MRWSLQCQVLLAQIWTLLAVRPEYRAKLAEWTKGPENPAVEDATNRSLFQDLPTKLEPVVGRRLPLWQVEAAVIGTAVLLMLLIMCCMMRKKQAPATAYTLPTAAGEPEAGEGTLDQKLSLLKKQKTKILMHQVIEKQKLERILRDIMTLEAERKQEAGDIDPEAVKAKAEETIKAVDISMSKNMTSALAYMMPMVMQSQRIYETIDKRSKKAQEMIARAAVDEVKNLTKDMQDVFEVQDIKGQLFKSLGEIDTPSLATMIASAFAPAQLRALHISNYISLMMVLMVVIIDTLILVGDRGFTCDSFVGVGGEVKPDAVDLWYKVDLGIGAFCLLVRFWTVRTLSPLVQEMNNPPMLQMQEDPVQALRALLAYYLNTGSQAIMRVDDVTGSALYALSNWTVLFNLIWIGVAGDLVLNTPWSSCHDPGLIILRIRFVFFLIFIVPVLLNVVLFFAGRMLNGEGLQISLLNSASKADEGLGIGVPLCSILVQAFFIRNKRDMINIQLKILQMKKEDAEKKRLEAEKELQKLQGDETSQSAEVETLQHRLEEEAGKDDDDFVKEQEEQREKVLQEAEQVFGLLNERAKKASGEAEAQVKKWEEGQGGELLQAISKGEGTMKLQEMLGQVDVQGMASDYAKQAQQMAGDLQSQDWVKDATQRAQQAAQEAQKASEELYSSEQVQEMMKGEHFQAALQAGQEVASRASGAAQIAQDAMSSSK